jgi:hypothetical protein
MSNIEALQKWYNHSPLSFLSMNCFSSGGCTFGILAGFLDYNLFGFCCGIRYVKRSTGTPYRAVLCLRYLLQRADSLT